MKNSMSIFKLLLFPLTYLILITQKVKGFTFTFFFGLILTPLLLQAGATTCHNTSFDHTVLLGTNSFTGTTHGSNSVGQDKDDYEQLIIPADGNITITITKDKGKDITFYVGSACTFANDYNGTTPNPSHTTDIIEVIKDEILYLMIESIDAEEYTISYTYSAPIIEVSIAPETVTVPQGVSSVDLNVTLSRGAINGDLNVSYTNSYDNSTNYFVIEQWYDSYTLTIDINTSLSIGHDFNITLESAIDTSGTDTGIITEHNTTTITIGDPMADLSIFKAGSRDYVKIGTTFYYSILVSNLGTADASNITVTDTLPTALQGSGIIDLTTTNNNSVDWNCIQSPSNYSEVICTYDGNISASHETKINLYATVPNDPNLIGIIYNHVSVNSDADYDIRNDTDTESTRIVATDFEKIDEVLELCYTDTTETTMATATFNKNCEKTGNFWSGNGCTATVDIIADAGLTQALTNITLTKMYAPEIVNGRCMTTLGTCSGFQDIDIKESPSYTKGYEFNVSTLPIDTNFTITDIDSYDGNPNNPADLDGIGIYVTYTYEDIYHEGRLADCGGVSESGVEITSTGDAIDTEITASNADIYNTSTDTGYLLDTPPSKLKWIQTRVASAQKSIVGVHLDIDTKNATPYVYTYAKDYSDFTIAPYLVDSTNENPCGSNQQPLYDETGAALLISIGDPNHRENIGTSGPYSGIKTMIIPAEVRKNARLKLIITDPNLLSPEGRKCLSASSTTGNLEGIGQCGNSEIQYVAGFGVDAWDRCGINNGKPCISSHGGYSGGGDSSYPGYNSLYDHALGCYMCTFNILPGCSTDNFAIRPDKFDVGMSHIDAPHLLRAGQGYPISLTARDAANNIPNTYTVIDHNFNDDLDSYEIKYFKDGSKDTASLLKGESDFNRSIEAWMVTGLSSLDKVGSSGVADEIVKISYTDVGLIDLFIYDTKWAEVDDDDTPRDCNSSTHTWICGDKNVTFIPHHFTFTELNITNHVGLDSNFTYIADNRGMPTTTPTTIRSPMAARIQTRIEALTKDGSITHNFKAEDPLYPYDETIRLYYENPVSVSFDVTVPSTGTNSYLYPDANETNTTTISDPNLYNYIGFTRDGLDDNGTRNILWNESDFPLEFNFQRKMNEPANPFDVNGSYMKKIKIVSHYVDPYDLTKTADISGSRISDSSTVSEKNACAADEGCKQSNADNNATFYYGRTRPSKYFYDDETTSPVKTPIIINVYCNPAYVQCEDWDINTTTAQTNEYEWWLAENHDMSVGDGNIELKVGNATPATVTTSPSVTINSSSNAKDGNVQVTADTGSPRPMTVEIDFVTDNLALSYTNTWLIYNPDKDAKPDPFYKVRFIGQADWAGHGDTGNVVDSNTSTKKNRRLGW